MSLEMIQQNAESIIEILGNYQTLIEKKLELQKKLRNLKGKFFEKKINREALENYNKELSSIINQISNLNNYISKLLENISILVKEEKANLKEIKI